MGECGDVDSGVIRGILTQILQNGIFECAAILIEKYLEPGKCMRKEK